MEKRCCNLSWWHWPAAQILSKNPCVKFEKNYLTSNVVIHVVLLVSMFRLVRSCVGFVFSQRFRKKHVT